MRFVAAFLGIDITCLCTANNRYTGKILIWFKQEEKLLDTFSFDWNVTLEIPPCIERSFGQRTATPICGLPDLRRAWCMSGRRSDTIHRKFQRSGISCLESAVMCNFLTALELQYSLHQVLRPSPLLSQAETLACQKGLWLMQWAYCKSAQLEAHWEQAQAWGESLTIFSRYRTAMAMRSGNYPFDDIISFIEQMSSACLCLWLAQGNSSKLQQATLSLLCCRWLLRSSINVSWW